MSAFFRLIFVVVLMTSHINKEGSDCITGGGGGGGEENISTEGSGMPAMRPKTGSPVWGLGAGSTLDIMIPFFIWCS